MKAEGAKWDLCDLTSAQFNQWLYPEALLGSVHCTTDLLRTTNHSRETLLKVAIRLHRTDIVKAILASPHFTAAMLLERNGHAQDTALHDATSSGQLEVVKAILASQHCTPTVLEARTTFFKDTALYIAVRRVNPEIIKTILESPHCTANVLNAKNGSGETVMQYAIHYKRSNCVQAILYVSPMIFR